MSASRLGQGLWLALLLVAFLLCLSTSWQLWAQAHYGYAWWYDWYDIGTHIAEFGPQNRFISGLESLSKAEHVRLFQEISRSVHQQGQGLSDIQFLYDSQWQPLLHDAEIRHLQDVARLIDQLTQLSLALSFLAILLLWTLRRHRIAPNARLIGYQLGLLLVLLVALICVIGPKTVFYQLHVWVFPAENPWFFYYQDSLMSTLMKAPHLFGGIALAIGAGGIVMFGVCLWALLRWQAQWQKESA